MPWRIDPPSFNIRGGVPPTTDPKRRTVEELWSWTGLGEPFRFRRPTAPERKAIVLDN